MTSEERELEKCASTYRLLLPRSARSGRTGGVTGRQAGGSLELHDFREYQPGDDLRQIDWNAVGRTDHLVVRVRKEEVAPRVEIVVDASRSMIVDDAKRLRTLSISRLLFRLARQEGLAPALIVADDRATRWREVDESALGRIAFESANALPSSIGAGAMLRPCGIRLVVSDLLFEASFDALFSRLADGASLLGLVQVLGRGDFDPEPGGTTALTDSESGERIERELTPVVIESYRRRFQVHLDQLEQASRRVRARLCRVDATTSLGDSCRTTLLGQVLEVAA